MINAKIIADSRNPQGDRITTMMVTFPRYILAELNTHRMFSRNSASSRAIPFKKMLESVENNPFIPMAWQKDHSGMQGNEYFTHSYDIEVCEKIWRESVKNAIDRALLLNVNGVTKQLCNRLLEPFMYHTVLITATGWNNFFDLRCPQYYYQPENLYCKSKKDWINKWDNCFEDSIHYTWTELDWLKINKGQAEIHMMALAEAMWDAINESTPKELKEGEWHIPFGDNLEIDKLPLNKNVENKTMGEKINDTSLKISTARCARVSYTVVGEEDKQYDYKKDTELHDNLLKSKHFSPFEHCAKVMNNREYNSYTNGYVKYDYDSVEAADKVWGWCRNFKGFIQYRSLID